MIKSILLVGFQKNETKKITEILNKTISYPKILMVKNLREINYADLIRESVLLIRYKISKSPIISNIDLLGFPAIIVSEKYTPFPKSLSQNLFIVAYIRLDKLNDELPKSIMKVRHLIKNSETFSELARNIENAKIEWERSVDSINDLIMVLDKNFTIKRINLSVAKFAGKKFTEIIGEKCYSLLYNKKRPCKTCPIKTYIQENTLRSIVKEIGKRTIYRAKITPLLPETQSTQFVLKLANITEEFYIKKFFLSLLLMIKSNFFKESIHSLYKKFFRMLSRWSGFKRGIMIINNKEYHSFGYRKDEARILKDIFYSIVKQKRIEEKLNKNSYYILYKDEVKDIQPTGITLPERWIIFPISIRENIKGYIILDTPLDKQWFEMAIQDGIKLGIHSFTKFMNNVELRNELIVAERQLHYIIENLREGIIYLNSKKEVVHINPAGKRMMNGIIRNWDNIKIKKIGNISINKFLRGEEISPKEIIGNDGRIYSTSLSPVKTNGKKGIGYVLTIRDITQDKLYTENLMNTFQMASLGEITAEIVHEINNPLTAIIGLSELLAKEKVSPRIKEKLEVIQSQGKRVASTVQALLMSSKRNEFGEFELNEIIIRALKLIKQPYSLDAIDIKFSPASSEIKCWGEANLIEIVLLNILKNAKESFIPEKKNKRITIKTYKNGNYGVFTIKDNGAGIPGEMQNKILETFFTTKQERSNLGIGLSICKRIVEMHKGKIRLISQPQKGTKFIVKIPLATKKSTILGFKETLKNREKSIQDILIIDDEEVILSVMEEMLKDYGYNVDTTTSPIIGIEKIKEKKYDIVFLDIKMPEMDGRNVYYNIIKKSPENVKKVVFFTGDTLSTDIQQFLNEVKAPYLRKPFTENDIIKLLDKYNEKSPKNSI